MAGSVASDECRVARRWTRARSVPSLVVDHHAGSGVRLAELVAPLSLATDLGLAQPRSTYYGRQ
jgi:hypothetical protein